MSKYRIKILDKVYEMEIERMDESDLMPEKVQNVNRKFESNVNITESNERVIHSSALEKNKDEKNAVYSPMPGTILEVRVKNGDSVKKGQVILILEAMKMENEITSSKDGTVWNLNVEKNQTVEGGELLFYIN